MGFWHRWSMWKNGKIALWCNGCTGGFGPPGSGPIPDEASKQSEGKAVIRLVWDQKKVGSTPTTLIN